MGYKSGLRASKAAKPKIKQACSETGRKLDVYMVTRAQGIAAASQLCVLSVKCIDRCAHVLKCIDRCTHCEFTDHYANTHVLASVPEALAEL